jgi:predicted DCC family thiol-disulfide oxidoreductase YuxK
VARPIVFYDEDCGFCRGSIDRLGRWDRSAILSFRPIQGPDADELLGDMDLDTRLASWHLIEPDGSVWSAGAAIPRVLRYLPAGRPLAALTDATPAATERVYRLVVSNRERLGSLLGQDACAVDPSRDAK